MQKTATNLINTVLLIDPDITIFDHLKSVLKQKNIHLEWASNTEEGFEKAKQERPDIIITDVAPKINGFEFIKQVRTCQDMSNPDFIIISGWDNTDQSIDEGFLNALGIKQFLIKSNYSAQELANKIKVNLFNANKNNTSNYTFPEKLRGGR